ncbi:saccharopine dehydrogenase C-terminal domain-containing protein, partial [Helicobacter sp. 10-6591]|uniref:saccharopine dehydrogenase family protein n=1 Tax=Helicobacter sp. 10-6591 TaxID=2004998 RepID=UPI0023EE9511
MTFGESYLTHMKCLENVGLLRVDEIEHNGQKIVPIQVLKTLLPDPASLAPRTKGQTHIGCFIKGYKDGKERTIYIYNICDHQTCYKEVNAQGVSYTTGVPAMIGAKLILEGKWGIGVAKIPNNADNSDMPKGGEYQGIDNAAEFADSNSYQDGNLSNNQTNFVTNTNKTLQGSGVWNMEQNDPDPFMSELNKQGLPYVVLEIESNGETKVLEDGRK